MYLRSIVRVWTLCVVQRKLPFGALLFFAQLNYKSWCHVGGMPITSLVTSASNVAADFLQGVGMTFNIMNEPVYIIHRPELEGTKWPVKSLDILKSKNNALLICYKWNLPFFIMCIIITLSGIVAHFAG